MFDPSPLRYPPPMLDLDPSRPAAPPRPAATVLVLRDALDHLEVLCIVRHPRSSFLGGVVAFPGGKVDPLDAHDDWAPHGSPCSSRLLDLTDLPVPARALAIAACRETLEEAAILPVVGDALSHDDALALRSRASGPRTLLSEIVSARLQLDLARLHPFARWVTPEAEARRFDALFFLLALPPRQRAEHDAHETTAAFWASPCEILRRADAGEIFLAPPTMRCLDLLLSCTSTAAALDVAARQSLLPICPLFVPDDLGGFLSLPGDPSHPVAERRVDGPTRYRLEGHRFVAAEAPPPDDTSQTR